MDNQFRRGARRSYNRARDRVQRVARTPLRSSSPKPIQKPEPKKDEYVIDLYDDVPKNAPDKTAEEVEELKKLAQSDALKTYAWIRNQVSRLSKFVNKYSIKIKGVSPKQLKISAYSLAGVAVVALGVYFVPGMFRSLNNGGETLGDTQATPDFDTIGSPNETQQPLVFDPEAGVAAFQDEINGVLATISQQPLPDSASNPTGLENLVLSLNDKQSASQLQTEKGTSYVVITNQNGNIVLFSYKELLIFIRTSELVSNEEWIDYINSLE